MVDSQSIKTAGQSAVLYAPNTSRNWSCVNGECIDRTVLVGDVLTDRVLLQRPSTGCGQRAARAMPPSVKPLTTATHHQATRSALTSSIERWTRQGFPNATQCGGRSAVTTLPAPIVTPGMTSVPAPIHAPPPIVIGRANVR
jgi:hypothetical protein